MRAVWLRSNRRVFGLGLFLFIGLGAAAATGAAGGLGGHARIAGYIVLTLAAVGCVACLVGWVQPRLAVDDGHLLVYARLGRPVRVPLECVEGFLLEKSGSGLPGRHGRRQAWALVVRLAEGAKEWEKVPVDPALAAWCRHYITLRGTWCEPLTVGLVRKLNEQLADARRQAERVGT